MLDLLPALRRALRPRPPAGYERCSLSSAQLQVLVELSAGGVQPMSELAARLGVSFSTATELVDKLVRTGKVARTKSERDRRQTLVQVTPEAQSLVAALIEDRRQRVQRVFDRLNSAERTTVVRVLRQLQQELS